VAWSLVSITAVLRPLVFQTFPVLERVVVLHFLNVDSTLIQMKVSFPYPSIVEPLARYNDEHPDDPYEGEVCVPMYAWQTTMHHTCNNVHQIDMRPSLGGFQYINCGGDRCAFRVTSSRGEVTVLKTLKLEEDESDFMDHSHYRLAQKDAIAMEHLSSSPFVARIYDSCAVSQRVEYSSGGNIHDLIKIARLYPLVEKTTPLTKLKIAYQVASAVTAMHGAEKDGVVGMTHNDLCCHQFILIDGIYKLNDFHLATFMERSIENHKPCAYSAQRVNAALIKLRAPEELEAQIFGKETILSREKVDVYMMGNIFYYLLTNLWIWEGRSNNRAVLMHHAGERSFVPEEILNSTDSATQALLHCVTLCWEHDWSARSNASDVLNYIKTQLQTIEKKSNLGIVRVSIPPLSTDHRYTDSDFYYNIDSWPLRFPIQ
jgi:hypothetical protein